jgi:excisionase family DNA binding protein
MKGQIRMDLEDSLGSAAHQRAANGDGPTSARRSLTREDVMTAREVGALLHLPGSSVYHLARRGAIPGHRVGRAWRFIRYEIEDWLRAS